MDLIYLAIVSLICVAGAIAWIEWDERNGGSR